MISPYVVRNKKDQIDIIEAIIQELKKLQLAVKEDREYWVYQVRMDTLRFIQEGLKYDL